MILEHIIVWDGTDLIGLAILGILIGIFLLWILYLVIAVKIEEFKKDRVRKRKLKEDCERLRTELEGGAGWMT